MTSGEVANADRFDAHSDSPGMKGSIVGLDIGGTKTRGIRIEDGVVTRDETTGSANLQNVTKSEAANSLRNLFSTIGDSHVSHVCVGAGGIDTAHDEAALIALIEPFVPHARITVVHDTRLLLAAGYTSTGVAVIAGTGSAAWGKSDSGDEARFGGWGYLLGDEGSGYWLGKEAVRHSLERMNQRLPVDVLTEALLESCGLQDPNMLIAHFHSSVRGRRFWAQQARVVVEAATAGHSKSKALLDQAGSDLAKLAVQALRQLGIEGPVILGGGLGMNVPDIQNAFRKYLLTAGVNDVRVLDQEPVFGVLQLIEDDSWADFRNPRAINRESRATP
ncbi:N-acetylglucosamine kinase [Paenarthrobacter ilicis]|uniref:N-acetylglucosamine kinase n=1 Tax=Paenarthrobacter ilicis TaxID=43665 RepID=UPI00386C201A